MDHWSYRIDHSSFPTKQNMLNEPSNSRCPWSIGHVLWTVNSRWWSMNHWSWSMHHRTSSMNYRTCPVAQRSYVIGQWGWTWATEPAWWTIDDRTCCMDHGTWSMSRRACSTDHRRTIGHILWARQHGPLTIEHLLRPLDIEAIEPVLWSIEHASWTIEPRTCFTSRGECDINRRSRSMDLW